MIIGGRQYEGDTDIVRMLTFFSQDQVKSDSAQGIYGELQDIGKLSEKKSLHKIYKPKY